MWYAVADLNKVWSAAPMTWTDVAVMAREAARAAPTAPTAPAVRPIIFTHESHDVVAQWIADVQHVIVPIHAAVREMANNPRNTNPGTADIIGLVMRTFPSAFLQQATEEAEQQAQSA